MEENRPSRNSKPLVWRFLEKVQEKPGSLSLLHALATRSRKITPPAPAKRAPKFGTGGGLCRNSWRYRGINYRYFRLGRLETTRIKNREAIPPGHPYLAVGCDRTA